MLLYFTDNDIILKLATYHLFWELSSSLKIKEENIRVLPTAIKVFSASQKNKQYRQISLERAKQIVRRCQCIDRSALSNTLEFQLLSPIDGIDVGEALLVAATQAQEDFYLLTSDKKFLRKLTTSDFDEIKQRLYKRVICLEQLINHVINFAGFDLVCRRIASAEPCDQIVSEAFHMGKHTKCSHAVKVLDAAIKDLRDNTGDLLIDSVLAIQTYSQASGLLNISDFSSSSILDI